MYFNARGRKILVVDSDRTVLELLQIRLDVAGYHAHIARTAPDAVEILKAIRPAALVVDLALPVIDGFELLRSLQESREALSLPTLVMGRKLMPEDVKRAIQLGARDCLLKPFSGSDMLERVARIMKAA